MKKTLLALSLAFGFAGLQATSYMDPAVAACIRESGKDYLACKEEVANQRRLGILPASSPSISTVRDPMLANPAVRTTGGPVYYYK